MIDSGTLLQDRFLIEEKIGMGGMGAVYRAVDQKFGSQVAIKETFYGDTQLAEAFEREARLLNGLHHPIFPHVSDYFSQNGGHFLVMEFIEGEDLSEILKRSEIFPVNTVVGWAVDILDGLDYLHSQDPPIVHRDIKPNNLKLTSRGRIVLLDFGMAKETSQNTLGAKSVFGYSRRYSPLEQIEGAGTDVRSDIFSLGASIYHLLTGKPAADALARASALVGGRPDPLVPANEVNPEVPETVAAIISMALSLNPDNRFNSAREMSDALEDAIGADSHPVQKEVMAAAVPVSGVEEHDTEWAEELDDDTEAISTERETSAPAGMAVAVAAGYEDFGKRALPGNAPAKTATANTTPAAIKSTRSRYALWVPVLLLCLGALLFGAYRGLTGEEGASNTPVDTATEVASESTEPPISEVPVEPVQDAKVATDEPVTIVGDELTNRSKGDDKDLAKDPVKPVTDKRPSTTEPEREQRVSDTSRAKDRTKTAPSTDRPARQAVKPAFERPAVSSIEAIFTGVPEDRRRRWELEQRDRWIEEDQRRRRIRQMRRENRRLREPF